MRYYKLIQLYFKWSQVTNIMPQYFQHNQRTTSQPINITHS